MHLSRIIDLLGTLYIRVGKTGSLGPWSRVILYIVASFPFAKMIPQWENHFGKRKLATIRYDSAPRPQRSCFAHPKVGTRYINPTAVFVRERVPLKTHVYLT